VVVIKASHLLKFSPEFEAVYSHHQAAEVELDFESSNLDAYKFAHQVTRKQRPILNFALRGKLWSQWRSCPPGVSFVPWG
jgi:hypothetical protein